MTSSSVEPPHNEKILLLTPTNLGEDYPYNAEFDKKFLENELHTLDLHDFLQYTDTLVMARKMFPGQNCSINALLEKLNLQSQAIEGFYSSDVKNTHQIYEALKHLL